MATPAKKPDPLEEAHFRIDEHERRLADLDKAREEMPAHVQGGIAALHAAFKAEIGQLVIEQRKDVESDHAVVAKLDELIATLNKPVTRTCTINLPSGPVTMTVREER